VHGWQQAAAPTDTLSNESNSRNAQAFNRATQLIDQMIADRRITTEGLSNAQALLQGSGQSERGAELMSRISAAVNRGDLTPAEAGLVPPEIGP
jgi:hypothetical protein